MVNNSVKVSARTLRRGGEVDVPLGVAARACDALPEHADRFFGVGLGPQVDGVDAHAALARQCAGLVQPVVELAGESDLDVRPGDQPGVDLEGCRPVHRIEQRGGQRARLPDPDRIVYPSIGAEQARPATEMVELHGPPRETELVVGVQQRVDGAGPIDTAEYLPGRDPRQDALAQAPPGRGVGQWIPAGVEGVQNRCHVARCKVAARIDEVEEVGIERVFRACPSRRRVVWHPRRITSTERVYIEARIVRRARQVLSATVRMSEVVAAVRDDQDGLVEIRVATDGRIARCTWRRRTGACSGVLDLPHIPPQRRDRTQPPDHTEMQVVRTESVAGAVSAYGLQAIDGGPQDLRLLGQGNQRRWRTHACAAPVRVDRPVVVALRGGLQTLPIRLQQVQHHALQAVVRGAADPGVRVGIGG